MIRHRSGLVVAISSHIRVQCIWRFASTKSSEYQVLEKAVERAKSAALSANVHVDSPKPPHNISSGTSDRWERSVNDVAAAVKSITSKKPLSFEERGLLLSAMDVCLAAEMETPSVTVAGMVGARAGRGRLKRAFRLAVADGDCGSVLRAASSLLSVGKSEVEEVERGMERYCRRVCEETEELRLRLPVGLDRDVVFGDLSPKVRCLMGLLLGLCRMDRKHTDGSIRIVGLAMLKELETQTPTPTVLGVARAVARRLYGNRKEFAGIEPREEEAGKQLSDELCWSEDESAKVYLEEELDGNHQKVYFEEELDGNPQKVYLEEELDGNHQKVYLEEELDGNHQKVYFEGDDLATIHRQKEYRGLRSLMRIEGRWRGSVAWPEWRRMKAGARVMELAELVGGVEVMEEAAWMLRRLGALSLVGGALRRLREMGAVPSPRTAETVASLAGMQGAPERAYESLKAMQGAGVDVGDRAMAAVLRGFVRVGNPGEALRAGAEMEMTPIVACALADAVASAYAKTARKRNRELFRKGIKRTNSPQQTIQGRQTHFPDAPTTSTAFHHIDPIPHPNMHLHFQTLARRLGLGRQKLTPYSSPVTASSNPVDSSDRWGEALQALGESVFAEGYGNVSDAVLETFPLAWLRIGHPKRAKELLDDMLWEGGKTPTSSSAMTYIRACGASGHPEAIESFFDAHPQFLDSDTAWAIVTSNLGRSSSDPMRVLAFWKRHLPSPSSSSTPSKYGPQQKAVSALTTLFLRLTPDHPNTKRWLETLASVSHDTSSWSAESALQHWQDRPRFVPRRPWANPELQSLPSTSSPLAGPFRPLSSPVPNFFKTILPPLRLQKPKIRNNLYKAIQKF